MVKIQSKESLPLVYSNTRLVDSSWNETAKEASKPKENELFLRITMISTKTYNKKQYIGKKNVNSKKMTIM